jgi:anti-anti-sigma factor
MRRVSVIKDGREATIKIQGDFVFDVNREFREAYQQLPAHSSITVDLSATDYMDSAGLGMLVQMREYLGKDSANVAITGVNETVRTILNVANFGRLFKIS